jgi:hypothetical protein
LVNKASIYEESLKKNVAEYADQKKRTQGTSTLVGGAGPAKRMAVGSFPPQKSQGCTSGNPPVSLQKNQMSELCKKCNHIPLARIAWEKGCSEAFGASSGLHACFRRTRRRIGSNDRYYPYTWI